MKRNVIKLLCAVLSVVMLFCVVGCDTQNTDDNTTTSSSETTTTTEEVPTSTEGSTTSTELSTTTSADTTTTTTKVSTTKKPTTTKAPTTKPTTSKTTVTTKSTTKSTTTSTTKPTLSKEEEVKKLRDQIGFAYYRMAAEHVAGEVVKGHMNHHFVSIWSYLTEGTSIPYLREVASHGKDQMAWLHVNGAVSNGGDTGLFADWKEQLDAIIDRIEEEGLMDHVLGFYFDEPLLFGLTKAELKEVTKYMRETYPELRVFSVFAVNAVSPKIWSNGNDKVLDPDTLQYHTDVGYDMYWDAKAHRDKYVHLNQTLKQQLGDNDARIWYVPYIANSGGVSNEQFCLDHFNMMLEFFWQEENPGGIAAYGYHIPGGDGNGTLGFYQMQDQWKTLEDKLVLEGSVILSMNE